MTSIHLMNHPYIEEDPRSYSGSTYELVSKAAYLMGVPRAFFAQAQESIKLELYEQLEKNKSARILRNLSMLRTCVEQNFGRINQCLHSDLRSIYAMPEYIPMEIFSQLEADGIRLHFRSGERLSQCIVEINRLICDRINNCRSLLPEWLNFEYFRELFIMEGGTTEAGTKQAADLYFRNKRFYPYSVYINWQPDDYGNILLNDRKFVKLLYQWHNDYFLDYSKVSDVNGFVKNNICDFIALSQKTVMMVDCENSDPYRLCATLRGLDTGMVSRIAKIMLLDDIHTVDAWQILEDYVSVPVEHIMTQRVKADKSLVDIELSALTCREHYKNDVDSFIIVSSDSDYWGLISTLPEAHFLVMMEREKCGPDIKEALSDSGIFYCYLDDFYSGDAESIKKTALFLEMNQKLQSALSLNLKRLLSQALVAARIEMSQEQYSRFYDQCLKSLQLRVDKEGNVSLALQTK